MTTVSDLIKEQNILSWNVGDTIEISAGTGTGKSYFIKHKLPKYVIGKIIILLYRTNTIDQFRNEIVEIGMSNKIDVKSYQHISTSINHNGIYDFSEYDYIVCDEYQFWLCDSQFNDLTDISMKAILDCNTAIKIFMSATGTEILKYMVSQEKLIIKDSFTIPNNYDHIRNVLFFNSDDAMIDLINRFIKKGAKAIIFVQSAERAYNLYCKFKDYAVFNCSKSNRQYYKYVSKKAVSNILKNKKFDTQFLITTCAFDTGIDVIDTELNNAIFDIKDTNSLIQAIGRERSQGVEDKLNLYK